jgi:multidrug efflux pump
VARVEMGANNYALRSLLDNKSAVAMPIFQRPGSNALQMAADIKKTMKELKKEFPEGVDYEIIYDTTAFVQESINSVIHTLIEAIILVVWWWCCSCKAGAPRSFR